MNILTQYLILSSPDAWPHQAGEGRRGPRPHGVPAPLHRDEEGRPTEALRLQEVCLDPRPQDRWIQGGSHRVRRLR